MDISMRGIIAPVLVHERDLEIVPPDLEIALMFSLSEYDKRRHELHREAKYDFFSKMLWPLNLIQAGAENYLGIDGLSFFDLQFKTTQFFDKNLVIELDQEPRDHQARLDLISKFLLEITAPLKKEFKILGIISPEILHGLVPLIKLATDKPITSGKLDSSLSTDNLINIVNQYNHTLKEIEEIIIKWHNFQTKLTQKSKNWGTYYSKSESSESYKLLQEKFAELDKKISEKIWNCRNEIDYLFHWALSGRTLNIITPINEIWVPIYIAGLILPNNTRKFLLFPPSIVSSTMKSSRWVPVDSFHSSFYKILKEKVENMLDAQAPLTQKFIESCKTQNLFLKEEANSLVTRGFDRLREKKLIEPKYLDAVQLEWQKAFNAFKNK